MIKIRDLGLPLLALTRVDPEGAGKQAQLGYHAGN
jgi:hypothetical protein